MLTATGIRSSALKPEGRRLIRQSGRQILLIACGERVFAIANHCPHEGYPLSEGTIGPDCVLTCNWHNWKFDLESGIALVGRDPVRTYPTVVRNGEIFVDISDAPADTQRTNAMRGLDTALADNDRQRMARETARLMRAGFDPKEAIVHAFYARNIRLEGGMTHAHAAAADWLLLADRADSPEKKLTAILEPLGHIAWDTMGTGEFPYASPTAQWHGADFLAAIEAEDECSANACVRGALSDNVPYDRLRPAFAEAALAHYADFGHCAIYVYKAGQLIERLGDAVREPVLLALTRMLVRATREDRLPEFRGYGTALGSWDGSAGVERPRADAFVGQSVKGAMHQALACSASPPRSLYDALLGAAAFNLLHFDTAFDCATNNGIADNIGWLDFTHALTFANACRHLCSERPDLWPRAALQMALFVGRNRKYVQVSRPDQWAVSDRATFLRAEQNSLYDHGIVEPIIACHRLKVLIALEDELDVAPEAPWVATMCAAVNRYLHTPMKRHHGLRTAAQALDFVSGES